MNDNLNEPPPPEPQDESAHRRETMLNYYLGALDAEQEALLKGRIETSPEWQAARLEAKAMLAGLKREGPAPEAVPLTLAERTLQRMRDPSPNPSPARGGEPERVDAIATPLPGRSPLSSQERGRGRGAVRFPYRLAAAVILACLLPLGVLAGKYYFADRTAPAILWHADTTLAAGAPYAPFLQVRDAQSGQPSFGVTVSAALIAHADSKRIEIGSSATDSAGTLAAPWRVPEVPPGEYTLHLEASNASGVAFDSAEHTVKVSASNKLVLAPDRTQARPGETIRVRALCVSAAAQKPIKDAPVTIDLLDPRGNRINRAELHSSAFGLAWAEFPLDTAAPEGTYKLRAQSPQAAQSGGAALSAERTIDVRQYALPAFQVSVKPAKSWFGKRDAISGAIDAHTFDGYLIALGTGEILLFEATGQLLTRSPVKLDDHGRANFSIAYGNTDDSDHRLLQLQLKLSDGAERTVESHVPIHVAGGAVILSAIPEAQELVPGLANRVYILARSPDGKPVKTHLRVRRSSVQDFEDVETDEHGVAVATVNDPQQPAEVIEISETGGSQAFRRVSLPTRTADKGSLLVRTTRAVLRAGEMVNVNVLGGENRRASVSPMGHESILIALRQDGRTLATTSALPQTNPTTQVRPPGQPDAVLKIPTGVSGVLSVEASLQIGPGQFWTDRRSILVSGDSAVRIVASADRAAYHPGDHAKLDFAVTDASGKGIPAAVSAVAVDEALIALTGENPGLAQALLDVETSGLPPDVRDIGTDSGTSAAQVAMTGVAPKNNDSEQVIDNSASALAKNKAEWKGLEDDLAQVTCGMVGALTVILMAFFAIAFLAINGLSGLKANALQFTGTAIALQTALVAIAGLLLAGISGVSHPILLAGIMWMALVLSHILMLNNGRQLSRQPSLHCFVLTLLMDVWLFIVTLAATQSYDPNQAAFFFVFAGVLPAIGVQWLQGGENYLAKVGAVCGGFVLFMMILVPLLAGARSPMLSAIHVTEPAPPTSTDLIGGELALIDKSFERASGNAKSVVPKAGHAFVADPKLYRGSDAYDESEAQKPPALTDPSSGLATPRLRWDFPEAMIFAPQIITDESGHASLELDLADSLTRWRVQADAILASGGAAQGQTTLAVTQPFSVDLILPANVTAGDVLYMPAVISNHAKTEQLVEVTLELSRATALGELKQQVRIAPDASAAVEFPVRFTDAGQALFHVTARAGALSNSADAADAAERTLNILPDGQPVTFGASGLIADSGEFEVIVPDNALPGSVHATLMLHRGPLTQMIDGLDAMLREPNGCFEQTSSTTYPNIMILRYLKANDDGHGGPSHRNPQVLERAQRFIAAGYQRLLGFEVGMSGTEARPTGSFSLYGKAPASTWLTAYGLQEFTDMAAVFPVDPALLERIRNYLKSRMKLDGSFDVDDYHVHESSLRGVAATAYVVMALGADAPAESVRYLRDRSAEIEKDPYLCALAANALLRADRATASQLASRLPALAKSDEVAGAGRLRSMMLPAQASLAWGYGQTASVEATALGVIALLQTGQDADLAQQLLMGLQQHCSGGGWGSTHATVLALKALECAASRTSNDGAARIVVEVNGEALPAVEIASETAALTPSPSPNRGEGDRSGSVAIPLTLPHGKSKLSIKVSGSPIAARVAGAAYVPWGAAVVSAADAALRASIHYDTTAVEKNHTVLGTLDLSAKGRRAETPMVEWGLGAGFSPDGADLDALKARGVLSRWEVSGRSLRLYLPDLESGKSATLAVRFAATARGTLTAQPGRAYEYYNAAAATPIAPAKFEVK